MKQIRFQPLNKLFQQLGTALCSTALNIQTTDYTATAAWMCLIEQVKQTCAAFEAYTQQAEAVLFPMLHQYEPALVAILRDHQCNHTRYLKDLCALFTAAQSATNKEKSKLFSHKLLYRFDEFVAAVLQQLNDDERTINAVLWRYYTDKELVQVAQSFVTPAAPARKRDIDFADSIIKTILPAAAAMQPAPKRRIANKALQQHRAAKALAVAI